MNIARAFEIAAAFLTQRLEGERAVKLTVLEKQIAAEPDESKHPALRAAFEVAMAVLENEMECQLAFLRHARELLEENADCVKETALEAAFRKRVAFLDHQRRMKRLRARRELLPEETLCGLIASVLMILLEAQNRPKARIYEPEQRYLLLVYLRELAEVAKPLRRTRPDF